MKAIIALLLTAGWFKNDTGAIIEKTLMPLEAIHELYQLATTLNMPFDVLSDEVVMQLPSALIILQFIVL